MSEQGKKSWGGIVNAFIGRDKAIESLKDERDILKFQLDSLSDTHEIARTVIKELQATIKQQQAVIDLYDTAVSEAQCMSADNPDGAAADEALKDFNETMEKIREIEEALNKLEDNTDEVEG